MGDFRWYVAQALAGLEATAIYHLSRAGISAFSPVVRRIALPPLRLYPGYVFVELEDVTEAGIVNKTRGINKLLPRHAQEPSPLPGAFVDELREQIGLGAFDERSADDLVRKFVPKETLVAIGGPFAGHEGEFVRYHKGCGIILGYLLGGKIEIPIPSHQLAPARNSSGRGARRVGDNVAA